MKVFVLNTGGTLGMVGDPLRPAKSAEELFEGINVPDGVKLKLADFESRQDSTNILHSERVKMAKQIESVYQDHDAFIILHGTDSLAETTAAFCMIFKQSLQKPLFVIGAQMTKDESGSDVKMQIENTLRTAEGFVSNKIVGIYTICMGKILDGSRLTKRADSDFDAFHTPGRHPVAHAWPRIYFGENLRKFDPVLSVQGLRLDTDFATKVVTIKVSADTPPNILTSLVEAKIIEGVILECKGSGQVPNREWEFNQKKISWISAIKLATDNNIHVAIISPFEDGRVNLDRYQLGQLAKKAGAISLESLTPRRGKPQCLALGKDSDP
ncbi:asparaginase [Patescibacteria group bacterium]|nr:asparaginase [Patescibacteria group bacterium]